MGVTVQSIYSINATNIKLSQATAPVLLPQSRPKNRVIYRSRELTLIDRSGNYCQLDVISPNELY